MGHRIVVEQLVPAEPARVYSAWLSPGDLATWWWPHIPDTTYWVDGRPGGSYEIRSEAAGIGVEGEFLALDPPAAIEMTWRWLNDGVSEVEETVNIRFRPEADGTRVVLTHDLADIAGEGADIRQGWEDVMARLPTACV